MDFVRLRWSMRRSAVSLGLAFAGVLAAAVSPAAGAFTPHRPFTPVPPPCAAGDGITGFAASAASWLVLCTNPGFSDESRSTRVRWTATQGEQWSDVPLDPALGEYASGDGVSVAPDGAFWLLRVTGTTTQLVRVDATTGAGSAHPGPVVPDGLLGISAPGWDAKGHALLAMSGVDHSGLFVAVRRRTDTGDWAQAALARGFGSLGRIELRTGPAGVFLEEGDERFRLVDSSLVPAPREPVIDDAGVYSTGRGISLDGGKTTAIPDVGVGVVENESGSLLLDGAVLERYSPVVFGANGLIAPEGADRVIGVAGGYVAVSERSGSAAVLAFAPDGAPAQDALSPTFARWLARANELRAAAQLAPLTGDAAISRAAENHSRYWTLNPAPEETLSYHDETPGRPGFTGESPTDRFAYVGVSCGSEIMFPGVSEPIDGWAATVYHRGLLLDPTNARAGGGIVGDGPAVMNGARAAGLLVAPTGFPQGRYDGPLSFAGEAPDPAVACRRSKQPVGKPFGVTVTVWAPSGSLSGLEVRPRGGSRLKGCVLEDGFMQGGFTAAPALHLLPPAPLRAGTTYDVSARWTPVADAASRPVAWSFTTAGSSGPSRRSRGCHASVRPLRRSVRRGAKLAVRYRACRPAMLSLRLWRARGASRKLAIRRTVRISRKLRGTVIVRSRKLAAGRYRLSARLGKARTRTWAVRIRPRATR
jgi:hypothetical protein